MKKIISVALAVSCLFAATSAFAETSGGGMDGKKKQHMTKSHKMHTKSVKTKATTPTMPKTGMGGSSE